LAREILRLSHLEEPEMPVLPTLIQNIYFYASIAAFVVFWVALFIGWMYATVLPAGRKTRSAHAQSQARHAA
jgi:hypothetical protein